MLWLLAMFRAALLLFKQAQLNTKIKLVKILTHGDLCRMDIELLWRRLKEMTAKDFKFFMSRTQITKK
jgi:hypothetical protein